MSSRAQPVAAKPWEQREGESAKAFAAFQQYVKLGTRRSLDAIAAVLYRAGQEPATDRPRRPIPGQLKTWSVRFEWVARSTAWDRHQASVRQRALEEEERKLARDAVKARRDLLRRAHEFGVKAIEQADFFISLPPAEEKVVSSGASGATVTHIHPVEVIDRYRATRMAAEAFGVALRAIERTVELSAPAARAPEESATEAHIEAAESRVLTFRRRMQLIGVPAEPPDDEPEHDAEPAG